VGSFGRSGDWPAGEQLRTFAEEHPGCEAVGLWEEGAGVQVYQQEGSRGSSQGKRGSSPHPKMILSIVLFIITKI